MNISHKQIMDRVKCNAVDSYPHCNCGWNNGDHAPGCVFLDAYERAYEQLEDESYQEEMEAKTEYEMRLANEDAYHRDEYPEDYAY